MTERYEHALCSSRSVVKAVIFFFKASLSLRASNLAFSPSRVRILVSVDTWGSFEVSTDHGFNAVLLIHVLFAGSDHHVFTVFTFLKDYILNSHLTERTYLGYGLASCSLPTSLRSTTYRSGSHLHASLQNPSADPFFLVSVPRFSM